MTDPAPRRIQDVRFSIGRNGRYYFYARDTYRNRTIFLSFAEAVTYSEPTSDGLLFSPGYLLPYGEINYKVTSYLIWTNILWRRKHYKRMPISEPTSGQIIGWTIMFREVPDGETYVKDARMAIGTPLNMTKLVDDTQRIIAKVITGDSDEIVIIYSLDKQGKVLEQTAQSTKKRGKQTTVEIISVTWFIDTLVHQYKKFVDNLPNSPLPIVK